MAVYRGNCQAATFTSLHRPCSMHCGQGGGVGGRASACGCRKRRCPGRYRCQLPSAGPVTGSPSCKRRCPGRYRCQPQPGSAPCQSGWAHLGRSPQARPPGSPGTGNQEPYFVKGLVVGLIIAGVAFPAIVVGFPVRFPGLPLGRLRCVGLVIAGVGLPSQVKGLCVVVVRHSAC